MGGARAAGAQGRRPRARYRGGEEPRGRGRLLGDRGGDHPARARDDRPAEGQRRDLRGGAADIRRPRPRRSRIPDVPLSRNGEFPGGVRRSAFGKEIAFMDTLLPLAAKCGAALKRRRETVAIAESSAGGLIAAALLAIPGASTYFLGGGVVYTKQARDALLGITAEDLEELRIRP